MTRNFRKRRPAKIIRARNSHMTRALNEGVSSLLGGHMIRLSHRNESPPVIVGQPRTSVARKTRSAFPPDSDTQRPNQFPVRWSDWNMLRGAYHDLRFVIGRVTS